MKSRRVPGLIAARLLDAGLPAAALPVAWPLAAAWLALAALSGCGGEDSTSPGSEPGAPLAVTDLRAVSATTTTITLRWTAPAGPGGAGDATSYDLRHIPLGQEGAEWQGWTAVSGLPAPAASGSEQQTTVTGLSAGQVYAFSLRATAGGAWSDLSNIAVATADPGLDTTPPAAVTSALLWWRRPTSLRVAWEPAGDDTIYGEASGYEVRYAVSPLDEAGWAAATAAPPPAFDAAIGRWASTVEGLVAGQTYHLAVKARDEAGNWSGLSNAVHSAGDERQVWYVKVDGSGTVPTIAEAVSSARPGDRILVAPGRYTWTNQHAPHFLDAMIFVGRDTTGFELIGEEGPAATILDAEGLGRVLTLQKDNEILIQGFTITHGTSVPSDSTGVPKAGGLLAHNTSPTIRDCIFTENEGSAGGAVWYGGRGHPLFENCQFVRNTAQWYGGALYLVNSPGLGGDPQDGPTLRGCTIVENEAVEDFGGGICAADIIFFLENSVVAGNTAAQSGGGIYITGHGIPEDPLAGDAITGCTIVGNRAVQGAALRLRYNESLDQHVRLELTRTIVAMNEGYLPISLYTGSVLLAGCCDLYANSSGDDWPVGTTDLGGNFSADPRFCGAAAGNYGLAADSPCAPGQHPGGNDCGLVGARQVGCGR
jgi:hypothetical protein